MKYSPNGSTENLASKCISNIFLSNKTGLNLDDNCNSSLFNIHVRTSECNFQVTFILPNFHKHKSKD